MSFIFWASHVVIILIVAFVLYVCEQVRRRYEELPVVWQYPALVIAFCVYLVFVMLGAMEGVQLYLAVMK